jgi:tetratricopeptide (TPR) repeat protein
VVDGEVSVPNIPQTDLLKPKSWEEFEDIVADLYKRIWEDPEVTRYGRRGQRQQGVDIYGQPERLEGGYAGIQCKRLEQGGLTRAIIEEEIAKAERFTPRLSEYVIATTDRRDAKVQQAVREINDTRRSVGKFPVGVVFWEDLCSKLAHPENRDLLQKHYGDLLPRIRAAVRSLHQIPEPTQIFKGREKELDELTQANREGGVTISGVRGMGGIGKTELALKLAERLAPEYPDAQIFVDLKGTSSSPLAPADAMGEVIHAFHPEVELPANESERSGLYRSALHGKEAICVLDDAASAEQVRPLVPPSSCALLVTSRTRFVVAGMHTLDLDTLDRQDARALLYEIVPRIGDSADQIARLCGYLPLALEVAASALAERVDLAPAEYARCLRDKRRRLGLVDASLSLSYDLLSERLQRLWARLAVFSIPFDREAAAAVWQVEIDEAVETLGELLRFSLIDWKQDFGRYDFHDLARIFAHDKLDQIEDSRQIHRLAAEYLEGKLKDKERGGTPLEGLEAADQWEQAEAWESFARAANALVGSVDRVGYWEEIEKRLERALRAVTNHLDAPKVEATVLRGLGGIALNKAEWDRAIEYYRESLETLEPIGDMHALARSHKNLGTAYAEKSEWEQAIGHYRKGLEICELVHDMHGMAKIYNNLGIVYRCTSDWDRAIQMWQESVRVFEREDDAYGAGRTYANLGILYTQKREWDRATEMYEKGLEALERAGDLHGIAQTYNNLGTVYRCKGESDRAIQMYERSLRGVQRLGDVRTAAQAYNNLGLTYAQEGKWDQAIECYQRSLAGKRRIGDIAGTASTHLNLGNVCLQRGESEQAIEYFRRSLEGHKGAGNFYGMATAWGSIAFAYRAQGDRERAASYAARAYLEFTRIGAPEAQKAAAQLIDALGSPEAANAYLAQLVGESEPRE